VESTAIANGFSAALPRGEGGKARRRSTRGPLCYIVNMKAKKRRAGATETFSVSVDAETKRALRRLADAEFEGNLSALGTDFAEEARRRTAAAAYLHSRGIPRLRQSEAETLEAQIEREITKAAAAYFPGVTVLGA
jgi:hypothetical protein